MRKASNPNKLAQYIKQLRKDCKRFYVNRIDKIPVLSFSRMDTIEDGIFLNIYQLDLSTNIWSRKIISNTSNKEIENWVLFDTDSLKGDILLQYNKYIRDMLVRELLITKLYNSPSWYMEDWKEAILLTIKEECAKACKNIFYFNV